MLMAIRANNWDQSLHNLGFTDPDRMNQDFYSFFNEPNPAYSNGVVHHLMTTSEPQGNVSFGSLRDHSNPHVEASQILQALSSKDNPQTQS
jgi:hypothetical protein